MRVDLRCGELRAAHIEVLAVRVAVEPSVEQRRDRGLVAAPPDPIHRRTIFRYVASMAFPKHVPAKVLPEEPDGVVIDWAAALAEFTK
jgi:hypothetical protein